MESKIFFYKTIIFKTMEDSQTVETIDKDQLIKKKLAQNGVTVDTSNLIKLILDGHDITQQMAILQEDCTKKQFCLLKETLKELENTDTLARTTKVDQNNYALSNVAQQKSEQMEYEQELNQLLKNLQFKSDIRQLKVRLLNCEGIKEILIFCEDLFPKRQLRLINTFIQSKEFLIWHKKIQNFKIKSRNKVRFEQIKHQLIQMLSNTQIKHDLQDLKDSIRQRRDFSNIIVKYEEQELTRRAFKVLKDIIQSPRFVQLLDQYYQNNKNKSEDSGLIVKQQQIQKINQIFKEITFDITELKRKLVGKQSYEDLIKHYQDEMPGRQFTKLVEILKDKKWVVEDHLNQQTKRKQKLQQICITKNIKQDISQLLDCLIKNMDPATVLIKYQEDFSGRNYKIVLQIIEAFNTQFCSTPVDDQNYKYLKNSFQLIANDLSELVQKIVKKQNITQNLQKCKQDLSGRQYKILINVIKSEQFINRFGKIMQDKEDPFEKFKQAMSKFQIDFNINKVLDKIVKNQNFFNQLIELQQDLNRQQNKKLQDFLKQSIPQQSKKNYQIEKLFVKNDFQGILFQQLICRLANNQPYDKEIKKIKQKIAQKKYRKLQQFLRQNRFCSKEQNKLQEMENYVKKYLRENIQQVAKLLIQQQDLTELLQYLKQNMVESEFERFLLFVKSQQIKQIRQKQIKYNQQLLQQNQLSKAFNQVFSTIGKQLINKIIKLKQAVIQDLSFQDVIQSYKQQLTGQQINKIQSIISSNDFVKLVKEIKIKKQKQKNKLKLDNHFEEMQSLIPKDKLQILKQQLLCQINIIDICNSIKNQLDKTSKIKLQTKKFQKLLVTLPIMSRINKKTPKQKLIDQQFQKNGITSLEVEKIKTQLEQDKNYEDTLKQLQNILKASQFNMLNKLLKSNQFKNKLKKISIQNFDQKLQQLNIIIKGIQIRKKQVIDALILNDQIQVMLQQIFQQQKIENVILFNQSISTKQFEDFFLKHNLQKPIIKKLHKVSFKNLNYFLVEQIKITKIKQINSIPEDYMAFNLKKQPIGSEETLKEPLVFLRCCEFSALFQNKNYQLFLPFNIALKQAKICIQKILKTELEIQIFIFKNQELCEIKDDSFILQNCSNKNLTLAYYINLVISVNADEKNQIHYKALSNKKIFTLKQELHKKIGIKKQAQRWYFNNEEVLNQQTTLQKQGINQNDFSFNIRQLKSLQFYGFHTNKQIASNLFKQFYIEDDNNFVDTIKKSNFPHQNQSQIFRNQVLGYIFSAIKKHSLIDFSLKHIKTLVQQSKKQQNLWRPPDFKQQCYFNENYVLYHILKNSNKSLKIDIMRCIMCNVPVPLTLYNNNGDLNILFQQNYWLQNKAFTIVSLGIDQVQGKSQLLNIFFETNFKSRNKLHKQCQGGIQIQYNIFQNDQYSVNLIDISNDIKDDLKIKIAQAGNLIVVQTAKQEILAKQWLKKAQISVPVILLMRDQQNCFENRFEREQTNKFNAENQNFNKHYLMELTSKSIEHYNEIIGQIADNIQQFIREKYIKTDNNSLWKFCQFLAKEINTQYTQFNQILKQIEQSQQDLTKVTNFFNEYKILQAEIINDNKLQKQNILKMEIIKENAIKNGLASPLKKIIAFNQTHFNLSSQIMSKLRIFLTLLRNQLFKDFNALQWVLKETQKKGANFEDNKKSLLKIIKKINCIKDNLSTNILKKKTNEFIQNYQTFKQSKQWQQIIKKIKTEFQFQIQPKAFSVQNFWRQVIYMGKFDPSYKFLNGKKQVHLMNSITSLGKKQVQQSQNFQVINGDLLQMPTQYLQKIFQLQQSKKIMVIAIFGPQSSGKSTLLNFVLGCDFMSSAGRCTKGIYGTYFEISNRSIPNCEAILVLDTEGLFSNYENSKFSNRCGFDNKLVLFCLQVCDVIILNTMGDVKKDCQQILEAAFDSEMIDPKCLPQFYFVLNMNGGDINSTQVREIQKFTKKIVEANEDAAKIMNTNHALGMPMAFNQISRKSTGRFITKFLKPKILPSDRFYKITKDLCFNIMELITERGIEQKQGRTLEEVFVKMDNTWATINKYPMLTKHGSKKIKLLEENILKWKTQKKQLFLKQIQEFKLYLKSIKHSQIQQWRKEKESMLKKLINRYKDQFSVFFPIVPGQIAINKHIYASIQEIQPSFNTSLQSLNILIDQRLFQEEIAEAENKGFDDIDHLIKAIKQNQLINNSEISKQEKTNRFQKCWHNIQKQRQNKLNRKANSQQIYLNTIQMYNHYLKTDRTRKNVEIQKKNQLMNLNQLDIKQFYQKLKQNFKNQFKNSNVFEGSNHAPIMNIRKQNGDLSFKFLDMSKYFEPHRTMNYFVVDSKKIKASIDLKAITNFLNESMSNQNLHQDFVKKLQSNLQVFGVKIKSIKLKEAIESALSMGWYNLLNYGRVLINYQDIDKCFDSRISVRQNNHEYQIHYSFEKICSYFCDNENLNRYGYGYGSYQKNDRQFNKTLFKSKLTVFEKIPNFQNHMKSLINDKYKLLYQQQTKKKIIASITNLAIQDYAKNIAKDITKDKKYQLQCFIIDKLNQDLCKLNINSPNLINIFSPENRHNIKIQVIQNYKQFKLASENQLKQRLSSFSKYWNIESLSKIYSKIQKIQYIQYQKKIIGHFLKDQISIKKQYQEKSILKKYINKEYNQFLNQIRRSNFTQFIREQFKYDIVFKQIFDMILQADAGEIELNQAIPTIINFVNFEISTIDKDLKQVSQKLRFDFIQEIHFFACHLLWKLRENCEWVRKQQMLVDFNGKKSNQLKRFLDSCSGNPERQNASCAGKICELYILHINGLINNQKEKEKNKLRNQFKIKYARKEVQIIIDKKLHNSQDSNEIMKYLLNPIEFTKQTYKEFYEQSAQEIKKYKYMLTDSLINDLLECLIQFDTQTIDESKHIAEEIFEGKINQNLSSCFIPLFCEVLLKQKDPYVSSNNKIGLKIKKGLTFKIKKIFQKTQNTAFIKSLKPSKILITNLKLFLKFFIKELTTLKQKSPQQLGKIINVKFIQTEIQDFKNSLAITICQNTCPCCKRNCDVDLQIDLNHKIHRCNSGHQMRAVGGMGYEYLENGVKKYNASIQRCSDLKQNTFFQFNGKDYTWGQFKVENKNQWDLQVANGKNNDNQLFFSHCWKVAGKSICNYHTQNNGKLMNYVEYNSTILKSQQNAVVTTKPTNYIFALDQSGSMSGANWDGLMKAMKASIGEINKINNLRNQYISLFKFNGSTSLVAEYQNPLTFDTNRIIFKGGGTIFGPAFEMFYNICSKYPNVDNVIILISDGAAEYPDAQIKKIQQLKASMLAKNLKLDYVSILIGSSSGIMENIRAALGGRHNYVANSTSVQNVFKEVLMTHNKQ